MPRQKLRLDFPDPLFDFVKLRDQSAEGISHRIGKWLPTVIASAVASTAAWHFVGSPWHVSIGALAGIIVAAALPLGPAPEPLPDTMSRPEPA